MKKKHRFKIPQMFYLRKMKLGAKRRQVTVYVYWNYRNTVKGVVKTTSRNVAKSAISSENSEAEFFR